jgi:hypothetical protein
MRKLYHPAGNKALTVPLWESEEAYEVIDHFRND